MSRVTMPKDIKKLPFSTFTFEKINTIQFSLLYINCKYNGDRKRNLAYQTFSNKYIIVANIKVVAITE